MARGGKRTGAGRKPGAKSKVTRKLTALQACSLTLIETLKSHEPVAVAAIVDICADADATPSARAACAMYVLDQIHGRPTVKHEHAGKDGSPIQVIIAGSDAALL